MLPAETGATPLSERCAGGIVARGQECARERRSSWVRRGTGRVSVCVERLAVDLAAMGTESGDRSRQCRAGRSRENKKKNKKGERGSVVVWYGAS